MLIHNQLQLKLFFLLFNPKPLTDNVTELENIAKTTKVSTVFKLLDNLDRKIVFILSIYSLHQSSW